LLCYNCLFESLNQGDFLPSSADSTI